MPEAGRGQLAPGRRRATPRRPRAAPRRRRRMTERYCVPWSLPWRIPCVGSWFSQKTRSSSRVRDARWVEDDPDDLGVAGPARADLVVGRVRGEAARVADGGRDDARRLPEGLLGAPEAAESEDGDLRAVGHGPASGVPRTACRSGTSIGSGRPGRASAGEGRVDLAGSANRKSRMPMGRQLRAMVSAWYSRGDDSEMTACRRGSRSPPGPQVGARRHRGTRRHPPAPGVSRSRRSRGRPRTAGRARTACRSAAPACGW